MLYLLILLVAAGNAVGGDVHVSDGDTLAIDGERIRLWGIDSPELGQKCRKLGVTYDCGITAREALIGLIGDGPVECMKIGIDRYERTVARCRLGDEDVGKRMVREGWALDFKRYSHGYYADE